MFSCNLFASIQTHPIMHSHPDTDRQCASEMLMQTELRIHLNFGSFHTQHRGREIASGVIATTFLKWRHHNLQENATADEMAFRFKTLVWTKMQMVIHSFAILFQFMRPQMENAIANTICNSSCVENTSICISVCMRNMISSRLYVSFCSSVIEPRPTLSLYCLNKFKQPFYYHNIYITVQWNYFFHISQRKSGSEHRGQLHYIDKNLFFRGWAWPFSSSERNP